MIYSEGASPLTFRQQRPVCRCVLVGTFIADVGSNWVNSPLPVPAGTFHVLSRCWSSVSWCSATHLSYCKTAGFSWLESVAELAKWFTKHPVLLQELWAFALKQNNVLWWKMSLYRICLDNGEWRQANINREHAKTHAMCKEKTLNDQRVMYSCFCAM